MSRPARRHESRLFEGILVTLVALAGSPACGDSTDGSNEGKGGQSGTSNTGGSGGTAGSSSGMSGTSSGGSGAGKGGASGAAGTSSGASGTSGAPSGGSSGDGGSDAGGGGESGSQAGRGGSSGDAGGKAGAGNGGGGGAGAGGRGGAGGGGRGGAGAGGVAGSGGSGGSGGAPGLDFRGCLVPTAIDRIRVFRIDTAANTCTMVVLQDTSSGCQLGLMGDGWCLASANVSNDLASCRMNQVPTDSSLATAATGTFSVTTGATPVVDINVNLTFPAMGSLPTSVTLDAMDCTADCAQNDCRN